MLRYAQDFSVQPSGTRCQSRTGAPCCSTILVGALLALFSLCWCGCNGGADNRSRGIQPGDTSPLATAIAGYDSAITTHGATQRDNFRVALAKLEDTIKAKPQYDELSEPGGIGPYNEALAMTYYDRAHAFYQLAERSGDSSWLAVGDEAAKFYRDRYVMHPGRPEEEWGRVPGYWNFSDGLTAHYKRSKDPLSKKAVLLLAQVAPFASKDTAPDEKLESIDRSREVAYALNTHLNAKLLGAPNPERIALLTNHALGHVAQWNGESPFVPFESERLAIRPFMMALTARVLIRVYEETQDPKILAGLTQLCDTIWENTWSEADRALRYANRKPDPNEVLPSDGTELEPAPDLHLLIFPLFSWVAAEGGPDINTERAQILLQEGTARMFWSGPKQYNQALFWSVRGVEWLGG